MSKSTVSSEKISSARSFSSSEAASSSESESDSWATPSASQPASCSLFCKWMVSWLYTSLSASLPDWLQSRFAALLNCCGCGRGCCNWSARRSDDGRGRGGSRSESGRGGLQPQHGLQGRGLSTTSAVWVRVGHARHVALCTCTLYFILHTLYFVPVYQALYLALYLLCIWTGGGYRVDTLY